jgi:ABC-2 type transport system permease protein
VSRIRWAASHLAMALAGSVVVVAAGGLGTGLAYGVAVGDAEQVPRLVGASLAFVPAVWVLAGVAALLYGVLPRASVAGWAPLAGCAVVAFLGQLLDLPGWALDLSPFQHVPQVTVEGLAAGPVLALTAVAAALVAGGLVGLRRRDVVS